MKKEQFNLLEQFIEELKPEQDLIIELRGKKGQPYKHDSYYAEIDFLKKLRNKIDGAFIQNDFNGETTREKIKNILSKYIKVNLYNKFDGVYLNLSPYGFDMEIFAYKPVDYVVKKQYTENEWFTVGERVEKIYNNIIELYKAMDQELSKIEQKSYYEIRDTRELKNDLNEMFERASNIGE